jgi:hypothetical protein
MNIPLFEGPVGLELLDGFRSALEGDTPTTRFKVLQCAKVRSSDKKFDVLRRAIIKNSNTRFIKDFMRTHWVEIKSLSDTDRAQIVRIHKSIEKERDSNLVDNGWDRD